MRSIWAFVLLSTAVGAAEMQVRRDVSYAEPASERRSLDVYYVPDTKDRPIILWIHGGGWRRGDKSSVQRKPEALTAAGYVFVSTNYRFLPQVTLAEMTADIARAIRWTYDHAAEFGGDRRTIVVAGHSAGAHLAALVCTDASYLKAEGLSLADVRGCVPVDVSAYDVPKRLKDGGALPSRTVQEIFGADEATQRRFSPAAHAADAETLPAFLILHVAERPDTKAQSEWFAAQLRQAGASATVVAATGKTHGTINADLGLADDPPTKKLLEFLAGLRRK